MRLLVNRKGDPTYFKVELSQETYPQKDVTWAIEELAKAQARKKKLNPELNTEVYVGTRRKVKPASKKKKGTNNDTD